MRKGHSWKSRWHEGCYSSSNQSTTHSRVLERNPTVSYRNTNSSPYLGRFLTHQPHAVSMRIETVLVY